MRARLAALLVLGVLGAWGIESLPAQGVPDGLKDWLEPTEPLRIVGPIYCVGTRGLGSYLITTPAGHILVNGLMPQSASLVEASIRKLGFKLEDVRIVIMGHAHIDHAGTIASFKKRTGAKVAVLDADHDLLQSGGKADYLYANDPRLHYESVTADRVLKDGDTVALGGIGKRVRAAKEGVRAWVDPAGYQRWVAKQKATFEAQVAKEAAERRPRS